MSERLAPPDKARPPIDTRPLGAVAATQALNTPENDRLPVVFDIKPLAELAKDARRKKGEFNEVLARVGTSDEPHLMFQAVARLGLLQLTPEAVKGMAEEDKEQLVRYVGLFNERLTYLVDNLSGKTEAMARALDDLKKLQQALLSDHLAYKELRGVAIRRAHTGYPDEMPIPTGLKANMALSEIGETEVVYKSQSSTGQPVFKVRPYDQFVK